MRYKLFQKSTISGSVRLVFILFFQLLRNFKIKIGLNMQSVLTFFFLLDIKVEDQRMILESCTQILIPTTLTTHFGLGSNLSS